MTFVILPFKILSPLLLRDLPNLAPSRRFVPLLLGLMTAPHEGVRAAATECMTEMVAKRMDSVAKLALVQQLEIVPACAGWAGGFPADASEELVSNIILN